MGVVGVGGEEGGGVVGVSEMLVRLSGAAAAGLEVGRGGRVMGDGLEGGPEGFGPFLLVGVVLGDGCPGEGSVGGVGEGFEKSAGVSGGFVGVFELGGGLY